MRTAHSAQIWRIFLPVYHRPSKMPGFLIWFYAILGRILVPEMRFPGISVGKFFFRPCSFRNRSALRNFDKSSNMPKI